MGLIDRIIGAESGGNPEAANPRSSAAGLGQFIDSTWLDMLSRHRPDITGSREELLALKKDPVLSRQMTEAYASDNAATLARNGVEVTPGNIHLAHFAGPQGAVAVLKADPAAPLTSLLRADAIQANPFIRGMTAADLRAWADKKQAEKVGGQPAPVQPQAQQQAAPQGLPIQSNFTPYFPAQPQEQQQAAPQSYFEQMPVDPVQSGPPILAPPKRPIDPSKLKIPARLPGGFFYGRRG